MADPFSIVSGTAGLVAICVKISAALYDFLDESRHVDEGISDLCREVNDLSRNLDDFSRAWGRHADAVRGRESEMWTNIATTVQDIEVTLGKLHKLVSGVDKNRLGLFRRQVKQLRINLRSKDIVLYRSQIHSYKLSMHTALLMFNVSLLLEKQASERDILRDLAELRRLIVRLDSNLNQPATGPSPDDVQLQSERTRVSDNLRQLVSIARSFHSSASTEAGGRSIYEESLADFPLLSDQLQYISNWIPAPDAGDEPFENPDPIRRNTANSADGQSQSIVAEQTHQEGPPTKEPVSPSAQGISRSNAMRAHASRHKDSSSEPLESVKQVPRNSGKESPPQNNRTKEMPVTSKDEAAVNREVTNFLVSTKLLLEALTSWSKGTVNELFVSDAYVKNGSHFNMMKIPFSRFGIKFDDCPDIPVLLRPILESLLGLEASESSLDQFLPSIRSHIIDVLHWLRRHQQKVRKIQDKTGQTKPRKQPDIEPQKSKESGMSASNMSPINATAIEPTTSPSSVPGGKSEPTKQYHEKIQINDLMYTTSSVVFSSANLDQISQSTGAQLEVLGELYPEGEDPGSGQDDKLYLLVSGVDKAQVSAAVADVQRQIK